MLKSRATPCFSNGAQLLRADKSAASRQSFVQKSTSDFTHGDEQEQAGRALGAIIAGSSVGQHDRVWKLPASPVSSELSFKSKAAVSNKQACELGSAHTSMGKTKGPQRSQVTVSKKSYFKPKLLM